MSKLSRYIDTDREIQATSNLAKIIDEIFTELETESYYVGQNLTIAAWLTDRLFENRKG